MTKHALRLVELPPVQEDGFLYKPFTTMDGFQQPWWEDLAYGYKRNRNFFFSFFEDQIEVARAEIELKNDAGSHYGFRTPSNPCAVIHFFEVAEGRRRTGVGTQALSLLRSRFGFSPLVAYSEEADDFWDSLGWNRHEYPDSAAYRPLYVDTSR
jgi:hypothetical protein